ncbi:hypothetical protein B0O99DRAFT_649117 [Bisporella sp. PMI_857]|nr:hypothetical protein B0O99DRAFT_649117 [Bisporella sp. PMI_857]
MGVSMRPMRLKVLYTFDDQNKTNCLARGQDVLRIQTVAMDETASIGIIDLKTCIEAVIQCSPELVNRQFHQLSNQKSLLLRVCKNILGIFNNGVKETLELSCGYFLQSNPNMGQMTNRYGTPTSTISNHRGSMNMEVVNQLLSPNLQQQQVAQAPPVQHANANINSGEDGTVDSAAERGHTSGYEEGTDGDDEPAPKKRAKTTQADWNSKSSFGPATSSLFGNSKHCWIIAQLWPVASNPAITPGVQPEAIPRAPTPLPEMPNQKAPRSQSGLRHNSFASQIRYSIESAQNSPERSYSPALTAPEIASSPPVIRSASPTRMRSSPPCPSSPVLPQMPRTDSGFMSGSMEELFGEDDEALFPADDEEMQLPLPKPKKRRSPLPKPPTAEEAAKAFVIEEEIPGHMELLPAEMPIFEPPNAKAPSRAPVKSRTGSVVPVDRQQAVPLPRPENLPQSGVPTTGGRVPESQPVHPQVFLSRPHDFQSQSPYASPYPQLPAQVSTAQPPNRQAPATQEPSTKPISTNVQPRSGSRMVRTASMGSLTLPTLPASDPVLPPSSLQRSQTWSKTPHPVTEAPMPIQEQVTPTWRKAWSQEHQGAPGYYDYSDEPGRVTAVVILARDSAGQPTSYQIVKKFLGEDEDQSQYKEFMLCNPCGLWMSKYKAHRPEDKWEGKATRKDGQPRKRPTQRASKTSKTPAHMNLTSEANYPQSEAYYPRGETAEPLNCPSPSESTEIQIQRMELPLESLAAANARPGKRLKAMTSDAASAALRRAIQSSPARWMEHKRDGSPKVLGEMAGNSVQISQGLSTKQHIIHASNKENCLPAINDGDLDAELLALFESELARPSTPTRDNSAPNVFKTPTRPTPNHRPITRSVSRSIRSGKSPGALLRFSQRTPSKTPTRRSPRHHDFSLDSPFTATIHQ